ncbi:MAG TPA: EAL domain-containing protein [candidate division Zixibacteria bacterium]|nr:EAL domain-containing protein [candidate division Zixibacteria bacterium]
MEPSGCPTPKILVVEDNPISRKMERLALEAEGYAVLEAATGATALGLAASEKPDLVLQDLLLPDIDGIELVSRLRALPGGKQMPILALTGLTTKAEAMRFSESPFNDFLFKPVEPSMLIRTVRTHLHSRRVAEKPGKGRRVLVLDDEPAQLKLLSTYLAQMGFEVATAGDGTDGFAKALALRPDAIVSDVLMPGMDGFQLCLKVRESPELARTPVVLISNNYAQEADKRLAEQVGAYTLVTSTPDFREAIEALLESLESGPSPLLADAQALRSQHLDRVARQLERHVKLNRELARRSAAQSAQLSVLASMGESFLRGRLEIDALLSDILGQYLNAIGFSCGAVYLTQENRLVLSAQIGIPETARQPLQNFYGYEGVLHDAMLRGETLSISLSPGRDAPFAHVLSHLGAQTLLVSPLRFRDEPLGVIVLMSAGSGLDEDWLVFSKAITNQIGQVIALSRAVSRLQSMASTDSLTGLANRARLREWLQQAVDDGERTAVCLLNLDRFQEINNTLGYRNGNSLLRQVAQRLTDAFAGRAFVARLGADEFAVCFTGPRTHDQVHGAARQILGILAPTFRIDNLSIAVRGSLGLALAPEHGSNADTLLSCADMALRAARRTGNNYLVYPEHVEPYNADNLTLLGELREAIDGDRLTLHYQPKVSYRTGRVAAVEALLRWHHPRRGWIRPDHFISLAERAGLIHPLTLWVVTAALRQIRRWRDLGLELPIAVNVSAWDLQDDSFPDFVAEAGRTTGAPLQMLAFELTERSLMADPAKTNVAFQKLSAMGVKFSIDDFGTGYSALSYLQKLSVNEIKIDRSFVASMLADPRSEAIVRSIIDLGRDLALDVVAEGVEDQKTWNRLAELGCDLAQGYHICRPVPSEDLLAWLDPAKSPSRMANDG